MTERNLPAATAEELARSLIASAHLDMRPAPEAVRDGILMSLGVVGTLGSGGAVAGAAWGALRRLGLVKWLATTAILGTAGVGAYAFVHRTPSSTTSARHVHEAKQVVAHDDEASISAQAPAPVTPATDTLASPESAREPESGARSAASPAQRHRAAVSNAASSDKANASEVPSLEGEVAALDLARTVLAGGEPMRTLELLDQYQQAFPKGVLRPEASYLRIQALSKSGQGEAARNLAAHFLAHHPKSPHAAQLQALISP